MDVTELITQIVARNDNSQPLDADYANRRTRNIEYLVEEFEILWTAREWSWRRTSTTLTVTAAAGFVAFPADYQSIGRKGGVWNTATGQRLIWVPEHFLRDQKEQPGATNDSPRWYSEYGQNASDFTKLLQVETNVAALSLKVAYNKKAPDLDESSGVNNLKAIPEEYHQSVLVPAVRSLAAFHRGDSTWEAHEQKRERGLRNMIRAERRPQDTLGQFPSFFGGSVY